MNKVKRAGRIYILEMAGAAILYVVIVLLRPALLRGTSAEVLRDLIIVAPIVPIWLMLVVVWRYYRRIDEFAQRRLLEILAISFGVAACIITSYPFLMDLGLPRLGVMWAWPVMAVCWVAGALIVRVRDR
jgi:hypothetical protein